MTDLKKYHMEERAGFMVPMSYGEANSSHFARTLATADFAFNPALYDRFCRALHGPNGSLVRELVNDPQLALQNVLPKRLGLLQRFRAAIRLVFGRSA